MTLPWHEARPELIAEIEATIVENYPDLVLSMSGERVSVSGSFPIADDAGEITRFAVEIEFPDGYPDHEPTVRETFDRIPKTLDRHVNPNGTCCLGVPGEWLVTAPDTSFRAFMAGPVRNYFLGQAMVEDGQPWPFGERQHGLQGMMAAYNEILGTALEPEEMVVVLAAAHDRLAGHRPCPCGGGNRYRNCHGPLVRQIEARLSPRQAALLLYQLRRWVAPADSRAAT